MTDLRRRSYNGVCRGGVNVSDLWLSSCSGVCRGGVCVGNLCRRSYHDVCRGGVCVGHLFHLFLRSDKTDANCHLRVSYTSVK